MLIPALARTPAAKAQVDGPVYVVLEGDSYWAIADRFRITIPDLLAANGFSENHTLNPGDRLVIPGYAGIHGILSTRTVEMGESLATLALRTGVPADTLLRLNRLVNPERLYAGQVMIVVEPEAGAADGTRWENGRTLSLSTGTPLLALAAAEGKNPWELTGLNNLSSQADQFSGQSLLTVGGDQPLRAWPAPIGNIQFRSLPLEQGTTAEVTLGLLQDAQAEGSLGDLSLKFRPWNNSLAALQGIYARAKPGTIPLIVLVTMPDGRSIAFQQDVLLQIVRIASKDDLSEIACVRIGRFDSGHSITNKRLGGSILGLLPLAKERGDRDRRQDGDDDDHHEQFDEGEALATPHPLPDETQHVHSSLILRRRTSDARRRLGYRHSAPQL